MASRSEEIRAHRFATRRLLSALVSGHARPGGAPVRRGGAGVGLGVLAAVVSLGVTLTFAVISPAADDWRRGDAVIVERETGARYVYRDGKLDPVLNYASARLVLGSATPAVVLASRRDLSGAARGAPLGIPGAPDSLPAATDLLTGDWSVCSGADQGSGSIRLGPAAAGTELGERALLVTTVGDDYVIWHGHAAKVGNPGVVLAGLGWSDTVPQPVAPALVNALPAGTPLRPIVVDRRGTRSPLRGLRVGTVVTAQNARNVPSYAVVTASGLAALTPVQADILLSDPATPGNGTAAPVTERVLARATGPLPGMSDWPPAAPDLGSAGTGACVVLAGTAPPRVLVGVGSPPAGSGTQVRVVVPPGRGALVRTAVPAGVDPATGGICLLTDVGACYPVSDAQALSSLGYAGAPVTDLPAEVKHLLPAGVPLDQRDALKGPAS